MNEDQLTAFFAGLDGRLTGFREMKALFDERVAFDFNMLDFFGPGENKVSQILAFFLDPQKPHGQKAGFLRQFVRHFDLVISEQVLDEGTVKCEDRTDEERRVDITIFFDHPKFAIGIENKIGAADQKNQVSDYCKFLEERTGGNYILFYLTDSGRNPSEYSLGYENPLRAEAVSGSAAHPLGLTPHESPPVGPVADLKYRAISYRDISDLLDDFEKLCRAENVRAFIQQFRKYVDKKIVFKLGDKAMSEQGIVEKYVKDHPEIIAHVDGLNVAAGTVRGEVYGKIADAVQAHIEKFRVRASGWEGHCYWVEILPYAERQGDVLWRICYEPSSTAHPVYLCVGGYPKVKEAQLEKVMRSRIGEVRNGSAYWRARQDLPNLFSDESICNFLRDKSGAALNAAAADVAHIVQKYFDTLQAVWSEICNLPA